MAKYRGVNGSVKLATNAVGEVTQWTLNVARPYIETTPMGATGKTGTLDYPGGSGQITAHFDYSDAAQKAIVDMLVSNADPTPIAFLGIVSGTGPKQISCNILPTQAAITAKVGAVIDVTFDFQTDGAITVAWT